MRKPLLLLGLASALLALPVLAENAAPARQGPIELPPDAQETIERGLAFLAKRQERGVATRGAWEAGQCRVPVTALCGLALLASGSTPTSGRYSENIREAVRFLLKPGVRMPNGMIRLDRDADGRPMYGHGFATLFLAECYGMGVDEKLDRELHDALVKAVAVISESQTREGGWYYTPRNGNKAQEQDEGSVTITQIQALRAARNAGIKVKKETIEKAVDYIRHSQEKDGGIRYTVQYGGKSSLALTAAGLAVLFGAGDYDSKEVKSALSYVRSHLDAGGEGAQYFHYTHFYAAQALFQQGGADWELYFPRIRGELMRQASDDHMKYCYWNSSYGEFYATALSLLILEIPYRYLPIYER